MHSLDSWPRVASGGWMSCVGGSRGADRTRAEAEARV